MNLEEVIQRLQSRLKEDLPGSLAHQDVLPVNRRNVEIKDPSGHRESAVSILMCPKENGIETVFIKRPIYDGKHSGQIAFPGGKREDLDFDLEETARRECFEEIGFPQEAGVLIGQLTEVYIPVSNFVVYPYLFHTTEIPPLVLDPLEVDDVIHFDVLNLLDENAIKATDLRMSDGLIRKNIPYFDVKGSIVWGATALMLAELRVLLNEIIEGA